MYIGKLNSKASGLNGSYCFMQRGMPNPFPPDIISGSHGEDTGKIAFGSGSLCSGKPVGWKWDSLMDVGLDIMMDLSKECFVGAVCIGLAGGSAVQNVEVFSVNGRNLQCIGRFDAQTKGQLEGEFTISIGANAQILIVRFKANLKDIVISKLDVIGAIFDFPVIYPSPVNVKCGGEKIALNSIESIAACDNSADSDFAARYCRERLYERFGISLPVGKNGKKVISIGLCDDTRKEGYRITVEKDGVRLVASGRLGLLYAVETLVQLIKAGEIPVCDVEDYPYMPMRGIHFGLPPREEMGFARRLIRYVLIPMRYNTLFIEFAGGMCFDKHPEISEAWVQGNCVAKAGIQPEFPHGEMVAGGELLEKNEVRDFVEYVKSYGFEVIPEVQSFGHVQYITYAHPEIAEVEEKFADKNMDARSADQPPSKFYHHSYCPSNEKSYEIIFDIIDEIVEVVKPERYVHMGHDEIYEMGLCPLCKGTDHSELYAKHVNRMYDYLKKKGLDMMIWSDMLQPTERYLTPPAVAKIPKDIVMLDFIWYFHFDIDMEDHILPHGFDVIIGNLYSSHYPRYESRIAKKGMLGGEVSTWCRFDEYNLAKKGKIFDFLYSAEMFWSDTYNSCARQVYTEIIRKMIPRIRDELRGIAEPEGTPVAAVQIALPKPSRQLIPHAIKRVIYNSNHCNINHCNSSYCNSNNYNINHCNSSHCSSSQNINGYSINRYSFNMSNAQLLSIKPVEIKVAGKFKKILFLHTATNNTARVAWKPLIKIGEYAIKYSDNMEVIIPVEYGGNICVWTRRYAEPMPQQYYRHQGYIATYFSDPVIQAKSECGGDITLLCYEWVNPYPDHEICSISCSGNDATDAGILLLGLSGVR